MEIEKKILLLSKLFSLVTVQKTSTIFNLHCIDSSTESETPCVGEQGKNEMGEMITLTNYVQ